MSRENLEIVERGIEAFNDRGVEGIIPYIHPEFEATTPPNLASEPDTYRGHDGVRRYWESFQDAMDEIRFEAKRFWTTGEVVVVAMHITAKGKRTGIAVEQRTAGVWTIRDRKAWRIQVYASPSEALESVGLAE